MEHKEKRMTTDAFKEYVKTRRALDTEEIHRFMDDMSNEARRITFRLNTAYHTPDEVRELLSELFGYEVPESLRVFPPFYADFGLCHTQSRFGSGRSPNDLSRTHRAGQGRMDRFQCDDFARRNHRRQCSCRGWSGRYEGCGS